MKIKKKEKKKNEVKKVFDTFQNRQYILLTCAIWSNLPKSWLRVDTSSEADSFSDNGVKLTMSAYKILQQKTGSYQNVLNVNLWIYTRMNIHHL